MTNERVSIYKKINNSSLFYLVINCFEENSYIAHKYDLENICLNSVNISRLSVFVRGDNNFNKTICLLKNMQLQTDDFLRCEIFAFFVDWYCDQQGKKLSLSQLAQNSLTVHVFDIPINLLYLKQIRPKQL